MSHKKSKVVPTCTCMHSIDKICYLIDRRFDEVIINIEMIATAEIEKGQKYIKKFFNKYIIDRTNAELMKEFIMYINDATKSVIDKTIHSNYGHKLKNLMSNLNKEIYVVALLHCEHIEMTYEDTLIKFHKDTKAIVEGTFAELAKELFSKTLNVFQRYVETSISEAFERLGKKDPVDALSCCLNSHHMISTGILVMVQTFVDTFIRVGMKMSSDDNIQLCCRDA